MCVLAESFSAGGHGKTNHKVIPCQAELVGLKLGNMQLQNGKAWFQFLLIAVGSI